MDETWMMLHAGCGGAAGGHVTSSVSLCSHRSKLTLSWIEAAGITGSFSALSMSLSGGSCFQRAETWVCAKPWIG